MNDPSEELFVSALFSRIDTLKDTIKINPKKQIKGRRFKNTEFAVEGIQGAILVQQNPNIKGVVLAESSGLSFDYMQVTSGKYDALIKKMLSELASMDFDSENNIDIN